MIYPIPAFNDNYIWTLVNNDSTHAWVVDPGDAQPVIDYLTQQKLNLAGILITHHHKDHTGGVAQLSDLYACPVAGPAHLQSIVTQPLHDQDEIIVFGSSFKVIATPGHTLDHLCYYSNDWQKQSILFSGDTLFRGGCGRLFEGSPQQMLQSLEKLAELPSETFIYCTHEYTLANYKFALEMDPDNKFLQENHQIAVNLRLKNKPTLPTKMHIEQESNPFLRTHIDAIHTNAARYLQQETSTGAPSRFAQVRQAKDSF